jgi:hypothetical protein
LISFIWSAVAFGILVLSTYLFSPGRTWLPSATALFTFFCYTIIAGEKLSVAKAFTAIWLLSALQNPMTALPEQFFALLHGMFYSYCPSVLA